MRRYLVLTITLVLSVAAGTGIATAGSDPEASAPTVRLAPKPPGKTIAALKQEIARLKAKLKRLRAANTALSRAGAAQALRRARAATARYRSVELARRDGYRQASPCESSPAGGMGFHFVNDAAMRDGRLDPAKPEILVYAPRGGGFELGALEYFQVDADQNLGTDRDRPTLFGRAFDGPMEGHNQPGTLPGTGMPRHYDLHVWLFERNPAGMFAQWNPDVRCG